MKYWADKIDLDLIESINNDKDLTSEEKCLKIIAHIQSMLEVDNLDDDGQRRPIAVKWFRRKKAGASKKTNKLPKDSEEDSDLPEINAGAFYINSEKSIYYPKLDDSKAKLTSWAISTIAHEMWHAKQFELKKVGAVYAAYIHNPKARMYEKNVSAYIPAKEGFTLFGNRDYLRQILEEEARAIDKEIYKRLEERHSKSLGKKIMDFLSRIVK